MGFTMTNKVYTYQILLAVLLCQCLCIVADGNVYKCPNKVCLGGNFTVTIPRQGLDHLSTTGFQVSPNGQVIFHEKKPHGKMLVYFHPENFCVSSVTDNDFTIVLCKSTCFEDREKHGSHPCLAKCCLPGFGLEENCTSGVDCCDELSTFFDWPKIQLESTGHEKIYPQFYFFERNTSPSNNLDSKEQNRIPFDFDRHIIATTSFPPNLRGPTHLVESTAWEKALMINWSSDYCVDVSKSYNDAVSPKMIFLKCENEDESNEKQWTAWIYKFLSFLPCSAFHLVIIGVYLSLWSKQNLHGWSVMGYAVSKFAANLCSLIVLGHFVFRNQPTDEILPGLCATIGILHHFLTISTHAWTTVITFDAWAKICSMNPTSERLRRKSRFTMYAAFAHGIPFVIVGFACAVEFATKDKESNIIPGFLKPTCVICGTLRYLLYIGAPNLFLFVVNLVLAFLTFKCVWEVNQKITLMKGSANTKRHSNRFALVMKLLILTGFFLIMELVLDLLKGFWSYFFLLEMSRFFHGLGSFWIFVWNTKTRKQLHDKYPHLWACADVARSDKTETVSGTVQETTAM